MGERGVSPIIVIAVVVIVAIVAGSVYVITRGGYPAISVTVESFENEILIHVSSGSIPAGEWAYSVSATEGTYDWVTGAEALDAPSVSLGTYAPGTWFVNVKHIDSGHIYFNPDQVIAFGGLPLYSGSENFDVSGEFLEGLPEGIEVKGYLVRDATVKDIMDWYENHMRGWTMENEWINNYWGIIIGTQIYRKDNEGVGVVALSGGGIGIEEGTIYVLATGPWSKFESL